MFGTTRRAFAVIALLPLCLSLNAGTGASRPTQEKFPDPPPDLTRVYYLNADETLTALPFEQGITTLNVFAPAARDQIARVQIRGRQAATVLQGVSPRFFVFVADRMDPPPHQLVRLSTTKSERTLAVSVIRGRKGYAPFETDNVRIQRRIVQRLRVQAGANRFLFVNYMEIRPARPLSPGEYAIIGDSLADVATFRVE